MSWALVSMVVVILTWFAIKDRLGGASDGGASAASAAGTAPNASRVDGHLSFARTPLLACGLALDLPTNAEVVATFNGGFAISGHDGAITVEVSCSRPPSATPAKSLDIVRSMFAARGTIVAEKQGPATIGPKTGWQSALQVSSSDPIDHDVAMWCDGEVVLVIDRFAASRFTLDEPFHETAATILASLKRIGPTNLEAKPEHRGPISL